MKVFIGLIAGLLFLGCAPVSKGDYVTYTSSDYLFMQDNFINQSMECLELGEMKAGGMNVKYCVGENYGSKLVQGFVFEHKYANVQERFIGALLSFKTKDTYTIQCNAETIDGETSGTEYINCMIPQASFDVYSFIMNSPNEIHGQFSAVVGSRKVYNGVIAEEGKQLLKKFYKDLANKSKNNWKERSL